MGAIPHLGRRDSRFSAARLSMKILERDAFLKDLKGWLREATTGEGRLVFIAGEAGIGKTVLLRIFAQTAEGVARVALGVCDPLSTPRPLGPLLDVTGVLAAEARRLLEENATRGEVFRTFLNESGTVPTLVMFEDVQWADEATLDLLRFLGRRIGSTRALLIATYRDDEIGPRHPLTTVLGDLATAGAVRRMALPPLSESAVRTLAIDSGIDTADLYRQTGGNPFFVTEVLASGASGIPATVRDAVLARASRLSPEGRRVLDAAAVIGFRLEQWLAAEVAGNDADALDECVAAGMLHAQDGALTFRHELARQAILEAIPPQQSLVLHRRVLAALRQSPATRDDLTRLAHHAESAGDRQAVLEYAPSAARRASRLRAHREAAAQFARALRFAHGLPPAERGRLLEEYASEAALIDHILEAIDARRQAIEIWHDLGDRLAEGQARTHQALILVRAGRNAEAERASLAALEVLEPLPPSVQTAMAYRTHAHLLALDCQSAGAVTWGEKAIQMAERFQDVETLIGAFNTVGTALLCSGQEQRGAVHLERSLRLAQQAGLEADVAWAYANLGSGFAAQYQFAQADRYLAEGIAYCLVYDIDFKRHYMMAWRALSHLYQARWADATETALAVTAQSTAAISRIMALVALGRLRARRGDPDADSALEEALELAAPTQTLQRLAPVRAARAEAAWLRGDHEAAAAEAIAAYDLAVSRGYPWYIGELAYWQWKAGTLASAPPGAARPFALQIEGRWEDASAEWRRLECPFEAAQALAEANDEGALRQALAEFERLGARPMAASVARRLREMGVRDIPRGSRPSTRAHPAHLTSREAEIIGHLGQGLRNREIAERMYISVKTVDHHISAVLSKLGVRTRTEAVREAARLGLLNDQGNGPPVNGGNGGRR